MYLYRYNSAQYKKKLSNTIGITAIQMNTVFHPLGLIRSYVQHTKDRIAEMFNVIVLPGKTRRK